MIAQVWTAVLLGTAVIGGGTAGTAVLARRLPLPVATRIALMGATGLAYTGLVTLLVGHVGLLGPWLPYALAASGVVLGILARSELTASVSRGLRGVRRQFRTHPVPLAAVSVCLVVAAVATLVPPARRDEVDYHWPAPLDWAAAGGWTDSPFRHVDAFPFMEIVYTAAATQGSYVAAHLLHFGAFLTLGFAVAGAASSIGVRGTGVTAAAALAMPVVWDSSYVAYNDTPVAAFSLVAVAVVLAASPRSLRSVGVAAALLAIATSIKPTGVTAVGVVCLLVLMRWFFARSPAESSQRPASSLARVAIQWVILVVPSAVALAFWTARQYALTGNLVDPAVIAEPDDYALTMLPSAVERLLAPLLPFAGGLIGASEPWGGRTAVVIQLLLIPAIAYAIWRRGDVLRRFSLMLVPAWAHWIVLGFAIVRTRFHVLSWVMFVVALRIALEDFAARRPRARVWLEIVWTLCILVGLIDVSFEMYRHLRILWTTDVG